MEGPMVDSREDAEVNKSIKHDESRDAMIKHSSSIVVGPTFRTKTKPFREKCDCKKIAEEGP
jgi:hypothetical protein